MQESSYSILVIDDDPLIHQAIKMVLGKNWKIFSAFTEESIQWNRFYHAAIVDMHLTSQRKLEGPGLIKRLSDLQPQTPIIALSGETDFTTMESCLKAGAQRYLSKPFHPDELTSHILKIESFWQIKSTELFPNRPQWKGQSAASEKIRHQVAQLRGEIKTILIEGSTGTGKEVICRMINAQEVGRKLIAVNCASISEQLFESEFFGHIKGAFTGAEQNKIGLLEMAHSGDLFLDEIEAMPLSHQAKLLRFLETGEFKKVGSKETQYSHLRVITATNQNLKKMIDDKLFREDLLYRLNAVTISVPDLRCRLDDIETLAHYFLEQAKPRSHKTWTPEAIQALQTHSWPGNVRELKRLCEQLSLSAPLPIIRATDVEPWIHGISIQRDSQKRDESEISFNSDFQGLNDCLNHFEKKVLQKALKTWTDLDECALRLKISKSNLYKKIKDHSIEAEN